LSAVGGEEWEKREKRLSLYDVRHRFLANLGLGLGEGRREGEEKERGGDRSARL